MLNKNNSVDYFVIGIDCSTTGIKAIAINKDGKIKAEARASLSLHSPQPNYYEQNPNDWWTATQIVLRSITKQINSKKIVALAISNQRETFVPLDVNGNHIRPAILWLDERCKNEVEAFAQKIGRNRIHRITGKPVDYAPVVYRLAWMKKHEPKLYQKIGMICDVHTYLTWKLTGKFKTSWASADPLGIFDLKYKTWSSIILNALELQTKQLPCTFSPGTILGKITNEASKTTGLDVNTQIVAGGGDGQAAGTGANALTHKRAYLNLGTAVVSGIYGSKYRISNAFRTLCSCAETGYYYECSLRAGTFSLDWFIRKVLKINTSNQPNIYKDLEREALKIEAGCNGLFYLPYLCGVMNPYWDVNAKGAFISLSSFHTRGHMFRAILEGITFEQLVAINAVEKVINAKIEEFIVIGGGAKSKLWYHLLANITGKNICIPKITEASAFGAAICASVGIGWYKNIRDASDKLCKIKNIITPDLTENKKYNEYYKKYEKLYPSIKNIL